MTGLSRNALGMSKALGSGRLTDTDHERIHELAEKQFSVGRIAQVLKRHPSTVNWYMYCNGLRAPKKTDKPMTYVRSGIRVHRFTDDEDVFIEALRVQSFSPEQIARLASARFGTERKHHSIRCRLKMLASRELAE